MSKQLLGWLLALTPYAAIALFVITVITQRGFVQVFAAVLMTCFIALYAWLLWRHA